jgi:hypothetical protein
MAVAAPYRVSAQRQGHSTDAYTPFSPKPPGTFGPAREIHGTQENLGQAHLSTNLPSAALGALGALLELLKCSIGQSDKLIRRRRLIFSPLPPLVRLALGSNPAAVRVHRQGPALAKAGPRSFRGSARSLLIVIFEQSLGQCFESVNRRLATDQCA